jgi:hypothetical protein
MRTFKIVCGLNGTNVSFETMSGVPNGAGFDDSATEALAAKATNYDNGWRYDGFCIEGKLNQAKQPCLVMRRRFANVTFDVGYELQHILENGQLEVSGGVALTDSDPDTESDAEDDDSSSGHKHKATRTKAESSKKAQSKKAKSSSKVKAAALKKNKQKVKHLV